MRTTPRGASGGRATTDERPLVGRASDQSLHSVDVADGGAGIDILPIGGGKRVAVPSEEIDASFFAVVLEELVGEVVGPRAGGIGETSLDRGDVRRHGHRTHRQRDDHVQPGEHRLGDAARALDRAALERVEQDRLDAPRELGREPVAGEVDEAGEEPVEVVLADEEAHPAPLLQAEDSLRSRVELVFVDLEQLVPRERLEDRHEVLPCVRRRPEAGPVEHRGDLPAQQGDLEGRRVVRRGCPEAEELVGPDAHLLHVHGTVDRGLDVGLAHGQPRVLPGAGWSGLVAEDAEL